MAPISFSWKQPPRAAPEEPIPAERDRAASLLPAAIQLLPDAVLIVDRENATASLRLLTSNRAAQELLRIRTEDEALLSVLRHPQILESAEAALAGGEARVVSCDTGGSQSRSLRAWTRLLPEADPAAALIVLRDETEARQLERMRVDFMANASHELRTPLASISGFIETLQGHAKQDAEARDRFLSIMAGQARRMTRLIDDLLSLSRIELNEHVPPAGVCDMTSIVREGAEGLAPVLSAKGVILEISPSEESSLIFGDRDQIAQIAQNLLDNAVKYSPEATAVRITLASNVPFDVEPDSFQKALRETGGRMTLVSPERPHEGRYVLLRVADHGPGIARDYLPRLTERFYRVPGQKGREISGTGLGLAIVKHVIKRHRGGLTVDSAPGMGTVFSALLPAAPS